MDAPPHEIQFDPALKELLLRRTGHPLGEAVSARGSDLVAVLIRLRAADANLPQFVRVVAGFGEVVTARVPLGRIVELRRHPAVASLKASTLYLGHLGLSVREIRADRAALPQADGPRLDGRGVIIGVLDWGADWAHEAFLDSQGRSRIRYLWDQRDKPSARSPQPYGYGTEYRRADFDQALAYSDPYSVLGYDPATIDRQGVGTHGTHVMSIAAGSGPLPGVAPGSELIFVHLQGPDTAPEDTLGDSARVLEAVHYVLDRAGNTPVVINMSLGRTGDAKDGTSPVEQALDTALRARPGRAICMSTGNYYTARLHAQGKLDPGERTALLWELPIGRRRPAELEIWYNGRDRMQVVLASPDNTPLAQVGAGETRVIRRGKEVVASLFHRLHDPNNGDNQINVFLHSAAPPGSWKVWLKGRRIHDGVFHAWIERTDADSQSRFHPRCADPRTTIGTICTGHLTIACGAYDPADPHRALGPYSSSGPTRDGRQVPLLAAPGHEICAASSTALDVLGNRYRNAYVIKSGTSMAAPHCTGVVALMMQAALPRRLWADEVRQILKHTARPPPQLSGPGHYRYGAGLVDASAATREVLRLCRFDKTHVPSSTERSQRPVLLSRSVEDLGMDSSVHLPVPTSPFSPERASVAEEASHDGTAFLASEVARPTLVRDHAHLEWVDLTLVSGSNDVPRVFYLVTGNPDTARAHFRIRIRNLTGHPLRNATIKWRFSRTQSDDTYRPVALRGDTDGLHRPLDRDYLVSRAPGVAPRSEITRELLVRRGLLEQAHDPDYPRCRMEVEYHWYEGSTPYYNRRALTFYLVRSVELMLRTASPSDDVHMNRQTHKPHFWVPIRAKLFTRHDRSPVEISGTITSSLSRTRSSEIGVRVRSRADASITQGVSATVGSEVMTSVGIGLEKIFEAGVESSISSSQTQSSQWTLGLAREVARYAVFNRAIAQSYTRSQSFRWNLVPSRPGTIRTLYSYPVFRLWRTRVIRFGQANRWGQASRREIIENFPVLMLSHWVDLTEVTSSRSVQNSLPSGVLISPGVSRRNQELSDPTEELSRIPRLRANEVQNLALEGGGGKGMVYLGAVEALEQLGVIRYQDGRLASLQGISGSSAGAIIALALALGLNSQTLTALLRGRNAIRFNEFFDLPQDPRKLPRPGQPCIDAPHGSLIDRHVFAPLQSLLTRLIDAAIPDAVSSVASALDPARLAGDAVTRLRRELYRRAVHPSRRSADAATKLLSPALLYYLINLVEDEGIFSGCRARQFFDNLIAQRSGGHRNLTFEDHRNRFGVRLVLTGSNLETGRTEYFSDRTTPRMPVADAVRISMGLPLIFKPVRISASDSRRITRRRDSSYAGLWVDGGLWNNLPMKAFDQPGQDARTLGLRLGAPQRVRINGLLDFLQRYVVDFGLLGSGEANQGTSTGLLNRVITLATDGLETTNFNPPATVVTRRIAAAKIATLQYFRN